MGHYFTPALVYSLLHHQYKEVSSALLNGRVLVRGYTAKQDMNAVLAVKSRILAFVQTKLVKWGKMSSNCLQVQNYFSNMYFVISEKL